MQSGGCLTCLPPCRFRKDDVCELSSELAKRPCVTNSYVCSVCTNDPQRPQRLNRMTLTLAVTYKPNLDISRAESVINNSSGGFGSKLSSIFGLVIKETPDCQCAGHKDILDVWTPGYIRVNMDKVVSWFETEARTRRIPFSRRVTKWLLNSLLEHHEHH